MKTFWVVKKQNLDPLAALKIQSKQFIGAISSIKKP